MRVSLYYFARLLGIFKHSSCIDFKNHASFKVKVPIYDINSCYSGSLKQLCQKGYIFQEELK